MDGGQIVADRVDGMDGIRAVAAISVLVHHTAIYALADNSTGSGVADDVARHLASGVLLFFTLSGFLLYRPFASALVGARTTPSLRTYSRNRLLRIIPAYWVVLFLSAVVLQATIVPQPDRMLATGNLLERPGVFASSLVLAQNYAPSTLLAGIGPAWTLAIEMVFYLALPIVALALIAVRARTNLSGRSLALTAPVLFLVLGLAGKGLVVWTTGGVDGGWSRTWVTVLARSFLANADLFAGGMAIAAVGVLGGPTRLGWPSWWRRVGIAVVLIGATGAVVVGEFGEVTYDVAMSAAATAALALLALEPGPTAAKVVRILSWRPLVVVGLASYSVYLWHEPVIDWLVERGVFPLEGMLGLVAGVLVVSAVTGILAALTYRFVELPSLRAKRHIPAASAPVRPSVRRT